MPSLARAADPTGGWRVSVLAGGVAARNDDHGGLLRRPVRAGFRQAASAGGFGRWLPAALADDYWRRRPDPTAGE
jgi:hypothetical protein